MMHSTETGPGVTELLDIDFHNMGLLKSIVNTWQ